MPLKATWADGETVHGADLNAIATQVNTNTGDIATSVTNIGTKQTSDSDLTAIAALTPANDDVIQRKAGAWANRTVAQLKTDLGVAADLAAAQLVPVNAQTANYTLVLGDAGKAVELAKATAGTVTVPPNSSVAFPVGAVIEVVQTGAGQVSLVAGSGVTVNSASSLTTRAQWSSLALRKRGTDAWLLTGDMT